MFALKEIYFYASSATKIQRDDVASESMTLKGTTKPTEEVLGELTGEGGPLAAGALPSFDVGSSEGLKAVWQSTARGTVSKAKPNRSTLSIDY